MGGDPQRPCRGPGGHRLGDVGLEVVVPVGLSLYEVLGAGQSSHADLRAGAARLLEIEYALSAKGDRRCLVLSGPAGEAWSAQAVRDVFGVDVIWRTSAGWDGSEAKAALGGGE
ncbi:hypothetical protein ABZ478_27775 [Streptomyces sp. NPDC005706]|uniref:hypothetical protein n=1 Tax=Streptomyces sp. NPDC005706 TaxID=3157169 RepID=UPI0033D8D12D